MEAEYPRRLLILIYILFFLLFQKNKSISCALCENSLHVASLLNDIYVYVVPKLNFDNSFVSKLFWTI